MTKKAKAPKASSKPEVNGKTKVCSKCETQRALDQFHKSAGTNDGYGAKCKVCNAEVRAAQRARKARVKRWMREAQRARKAKGAPKRSGKAKVKKASASR